MIETEQFLSTCFFIASFLDFKVKNFLIYLRSLPGSLELETKLRLHLGYEQQFCSLGFWGAKIKILSILVIGEVFVWGYGLVVKALDSHIMGCESKTTGWL